MRPCRHGSLISVESSLGDLEAGGFVLSNTTCVLSVMRDPEKWAASAFAHGLRSRTPFFGAFRYTNFQVMRLFGAMNGVSLTIADITQMELLYALLHRHFLSTGQLKRGLRN